MPDFQTLRTLANTLENDANELGGIGPESMRSIAEIIRTAIDEEPSKHNVTMHASDLCVGGPSDGQRHDGRGYATFKVPVAYPRASMEFRPESIDELLDVRQVTYRREHFRTAKDQIVTFWVPFEQTPDETLKLLLAGYEQAAKMLRNIEA